MAMDWPPEALVKSSRSIMQATAVCLPASLIMPVAPSSPSQLELPLDAGLGGSRILERLLRHR